MAVQDEPRHTLKTRVDKLNASLSETHDILNRIVGQDQGSAFKETAESSDIMLCTIEDELTRAVDKAARLVTRLQNIESRLS